MGQFFVREGDLLVSAGFCPDGDEQHHAQAGQVAECGSPPGFSGGVPPHAGARWSLSQCRWTDTRSDAERAQDALHEVLSARVSGYPPLSEFADAMYWAGRGDDSKLQAWQQQVAAVKAQNPKPVS